METAADRYERLYRASPEPALGTPEWVRERALRGLIALSESDPDVIYEVLTSLSEYETS